MIKTCVDGTWEVPLKTEENIRMRLLLAEDEKELANALAAV